MPHFRPIEVYSYPTLLFPIIVYVQEIPDMHTIETIKVLDSGSTGWPGVLLHL